MNPGKTNDLVAQMIKKSNEDYKLMDTNAKMMCDAFAVNVHDLMLICTTVQISSYALLRLAALVGEISIPVVGCVDNISSVLTATTFK